VGHKKWGEITQEYPFLSSSKPPDTFLNIFQLVLVSSLSQALDIKCGSCYADKYPCLMVTWISSLTVWSKTRN